MVPIWGAKRKIEKKTHKQLRPRVVPELPKDCVLCVIPLPYKRWAEKTWTTFDPTQSKDNPAIIFTSAISLSLSLSRSPPDQCTESIQWNRTVHEQTAVMYQKVSKPWQPSITLFKVSEQEKRIEKSGAGMWAAGSCKTTYVSYPQPQEATTPPWATWNLVVGGRHSQSVAIS